MFMKIQDFLGLVQLIFLVVLVMHVLRLVYGWDLSLGPLHAPMWASWVAIPVCSWLVGAADKLKKEHQK
jgi:hypothetical protein